MMSRTHFPYHVPRIPKEKKVRIPYPVSLVPKTKKIISLLLLPLYIFTFHMEGKAFAELPFVVVGGPIDSTSSMDLASASDVSPNPTMMSAGTSFASFNAIDSFQTDLFTGRASTQVPIFVPPGRKGLAPSVALSYSSGSGNGWVGLGWGLGFGQIQRSLKKGVPSYDNNDIYEISFQGAQSELVWISGGDYQLKDESLFLRVRKTGAGWTVWDKSGTRYEFGQEQSARSEASQGIFAWYLESVTDTNGNQIQFHYVKDNGHLYPSRIDYNIHEPTGFAATHKVEFFLEDRPDKKISYSNGGRVEMHKRLSRVDVTVQGQLSRRYNLIYTQSPLSNRSLLHQVTEVGTDGATTLPPVTFTYKRPPVPADGSLSFEFEPPVEVSGISNFGADNSFRYIQKADRKKTYLMMTDINGDTFPDRIRSNDTAQTSWQVQFNNGDGTFDSTIQSWGPIPQFSKPEYYHAQSFDPAVSSDYDYWGVIAADLIDLNGDGLPDRVVKENESTTTWQVFMNTGSGFSQTPMQWNAAKTSISYSDYLVEKPYSYSSYYGVGFYSNSVTFTDMNADGLMDRVMQDQFNTSTTSWKIQYNTGSNFSSTLTAWPNVQAYSVGFPSVTFYHQNTHTDYIQPQGFSRRLVDLFDINGDGLPDRVIREYNNDYWTIQFNTGKGFTDKITWSGVTSNINESRYYRSNWQYLYTGSQQPATVLQTFDINGDGLPDRVWRDPYSNNRWLVQINNGDSYLSPINWGINNVDGNHSYLASGNGSDNTVKDTLIDFDGDGLLDRVMATDPANGKWQVQYNPCFASDLLVAISNGRGGTTDIEYAPSSQFDNRDTSGIHRLPFATPVVTKVTVMDQISGNTQIKRYNYKGGKFDVQDREFRGFAQVMEVDPFNNYTVTYFRQDNIYRGRQSKKEVYSSTGYLFQKNETIWTYSEPHAGVYFVHPDRETVLLYTGDDYAEQSATEFEYDNYGNLLETRELGDLNTIGDERTTINTYAYNETFYIMNTLATSELYDENNQRIARREFYYDNNPFLQSGPTKGNLTKEISVYLVDPASSPTTQLSYDDYGNVTQIIDARGYPTTNTYDTTYHQFLEQVENTLGHTQTFTYDARLAKVTSTTDPNGQTTQTIYDALGRPLKVIQPGDSDAFPSKSFEYHWDELPNRTTVHVREKSGESGVITSHTFTDGLNRQIQTRTEAVDASGNNSWRVTDTVVFDPRGQVHYQYVPYFASSGTTYAAPAPTTPKVRFEYDAIGRKNKTILPDDSFQQIIYDDWKITAITNNAEGTNEKKITRLHDSYGRVKEVWEFNDFAQYITRYEYDARDNLVLITDHLNNITSIEYDSLGRKTDLHDPDTGTTTYTYDLNDNLKTQTDNKGVTITLNYDELNRVTLKSYSTGAQSIQYTYDDPAVQYSKGRLTRVDDASGYTQYQFDARGRTTRVDQAIDSVQYSFLTQYDALDRQTTLVYPDGEVVSYTYNAGGEIQSIVGQRVEDPDNPTVYIQDVKYNAAGQMTKITYGNDVTTDYTYDPQTLRLQQLITQNSQLSTLQHLTYEFDNNGNVKSITDAVSSANTQTFQYDDLNRLTNATGQYGTRQYQYNAIGNMEQKGNVTLYYGQQGASLSSRASQGRGDLDSEIASNTPRNDNLTLKTQNSFAGPHAVTSDSTGRTFQYDANGNMTHRGADVLVYDEENRLTRLETEQQSASQSYTLKPGWNLISFPVLPSNKTIAQVLTDLTYGTDYDQISVWDEASQSWQHFVNDTDFNDFDALAYGRLYQVHVPGAQDVSFTVTGSPLNDSTNFNLSEGVNYFGYPANDTRAISEVLSGLDEGTDYSAIRRWDAASQSFVVMDPSTDEFEAGVGYVITALQAVSFSVAGAEHLYSEFVYDHAGNRVKKITDNGTTVYLGEAYEVRTSEVTKYIFMGEFRVAERRAMDSGQSTEVYFFHTDHLTSTNVVTDEAGQQVSRFEYAPYGQTAYQEIDPSLGEANATRYKFTNQEEDPEVKLYYYNARYYDPELGRFVQADDIVQSPFDPQSLNRYTYVRNNPIKFIDPSGNILGLIGALIGGLIGLVTSVGSGLIGAATAIAGAVGNAVSAIAGAIGNAISAGLSNISSAIQAAQQGNLKLAEQGILKGAEGQVGGYLKFVPATSPRISVGSIVKSAIGLVASGIGATNAYADSSPTRDSFKQNSNHIRLGTARIGYRPLDSLKWLPWWNGKGKVYHAQIWYGNGDNVGFFDDHVRPIRADDKHTINDYFYFEPEEYDEALMRSAVDSVSERWNPNWCLSHNCQDFVETVKEEYHRQEEEKKRE